MSHFAKIDNNNIVTQVIVAEQDFINSGLVGDAFLWVQTSYNDSFRGSYATVGSTYNTVTHTFTPPQPYISWIFGDEGFWVPPVEMPADGNRYTWDEDTLTWDEVV
jgi:hypothetical protein